MAITTPNLALRVWNLVGDQYDHTQLASNWAKVDQHNHTPGKGLQIPTAGIENGAVSANKLAAESVVGEKLGLSIQEDLGLNTTGHTYRSFGYKEEVFTTTSTSYVTVDEAKVEIPKNGKIMIGYLALWKLTGASNPGNMVIKLDGNELKKMHTNGVPTTTAIELPSTGVDYGFVVSGSEGLTATTSTTTDSSVVTTGLITSSVGIFAVEGSHTITISAKVNSVSGGTLSVKNRYFWVRGEGYA